MSPAYVVFTLLSRLAHNVICSRSRPREEPCTRPDHDYILTQLIQLHVAGTVSSLGVTPQLRLTLFEVKHWSLVTGTRLGTLLHRVLYRMLASEDCSLPVNGSIHRFRQSGRLEASRCCKQISHLIQCHVLSQGLSVPMNHANIIHALSCFIKERKETVTPRCNPLNHTNTTSQLQGIDTRLLKNLYQEVQTWS